MPTTLARTVQFRGTMRPMAADVLEALARLEAGLGAPPQKLAWEPPSPLAAVRAWVKARRMRPGAHMARNPALLAAYEAHAKAAGWALDTLTAQALGRALDVLGFCRAHTDSARGWWVDRDTARAMALHTPLASKRRPIRRPYAKKRAVTRAFWPLHRAARPIVDTRGRVYPSSRVAAACIRLSHATVYRAVRHGQGADGCLWRFLTPEEVRCIPPNTVSGDVMPWLTWGGTVVVHTPQPCPRCGAEATGEGTAPHPTPSPQDSPHPPSTGPSGRGVTHIP